MVVSVEFDNNELAAFVDATLRGISTGVSQASSNVKRQVSDDQLSFYQFSAPKTVSFDIAVSVKREVSKGGSLKLEIFSIGAGVDGKTSAHSETVTRISFEIPCRAEHTKKGEEASSKAIRELGGKLG